MSRLRATQTSVSRLLATLALLAVLVGGLGLARREYDYWPVAGWPVYDQSRPDGPGPIESMLEVRAVGADGQVRRLASHDLVEYSRDRIATRAIEGSIEDVHHRVYLARLVRRVTGDLQRLEVWELVWRVDASAVPPLDRDRPFRSRRLVAFLPDGTELGAP